MNEKDMILAELLMKQIRAHHNSSLVVFNTNFMQMGKTNLLLLKGLLDFEGEKGFFVTLDRPHQYMSYLLQMHEVGQDNLWFIDSVTHVSGTKKEDKKHVNFLEGPFHIEKLFDKIELGGDLATQSFLSTEKIDFILIDNIATMLNYNEVSRVEEFINSFYDFLKSQDHILGGVTIDKDSNPELSEILIEYSDYIVDLEKMKMKVKV